MQDFFDIEKKNGFILYVWKLSNERYCTFHDHTNISMENISKEMKGIKGIHEYLEGLQQIVSNVMVSDRSKNLDIQRSMLLLTILPTYTCKIIYFIYSKGRTYK